MPTLDEELLDIYKGQHDFEIERKDKLMERITLSSGILVVLGGMVAFFASGLDRILEIPFKQTHWIFIAPFIVGLVLAIISFCFGMKSLKARKYEYFNFHELDNLVRKARNDMTDEQVLAGLPQILADEYLACAIINRHHNIKKNGYVYWSLRLGLWSLVCMLLAFPGFLVLKHSLPEETTNVIVTKPVEVK